MCKICGEEKKLTEFPSENAKQQKGSCKKCIAKRKKEAIQNGTNGTKRPRVQKEDMTEQEKIIKQLNPDLDMKKTKMYINTLLKNSKDTANKRGKRGRMESGIHTLTMRDIYSIIIEQEGKCDESGVSLTYEKNKPETQASIDRIDCNKGYTRGNVRLVTWQVNSSLNNWPPAKFREMCINVALKNWSDEKIVEMCKNVASEDWSIEKFRAMCINVEKKNEIPECRMIDLIHGELEE